MKRAEYIGPIERLRGKTALTRDDEFAGTSSLVLARFDDPELIEAFGWLSYRASEFRVLGDDDDDD